MANEAITINGDNWTLTGTVFNTNSGRRADGVTVEIWDKDRIGQDDALGTVMSDTEGVFVVTFNKGEFKDLIFDRKPDLYFKVIHNGNTVLNTESNPIWNADEDTPRIQLDVSY